MSFERVQEVEGKELIKKSNLFNIKVSSSIWLYSSSTTAYLLLKSLSMQRGSKGEMGPYSLQHHLRHTLATEEATESSSKDMTGQDRT